MLLQLTKTEIVKKENMPLPMAIQIEPTTKCNFDCITCTRKSLARSRLDKDLSLEDFQLIVSSIPTLKIVKLQGLGEPLANPQIWDILRYGKSKGIMFSTTTNGSLLNSANIENALKYLDAICVSIDSINPETLESLRKGARYDVIVGNLKKLIEAKRRVKAKTRVGINFVASHLNYTEISDLCELAHRIGLDFIYVVEVENWLTPMESKYFSQSAFIKEARKVSEEIRRLVWVNRIKCKGLPIYYGDSRKRKSKCSWCFNKAFITVDGYVTPCCIRMNPDIFNFGNVFQEPFIKIWNSEKVKSFRKSMTNDIRNIICDRCPD